MRGGGPGRTPLKIKGDAMDVRRVEEAEIGHLAKLWHDVWHESHARLVPAALARLRTLTSFEERLQAAIPDARVAGPRGEPVGFCIVKGDELYQLYVSAESRGTGAAAALLADAEVRLAKRGIGTAWLACAVGNERAARFYEKFGWRRTGSVSYEAETSIGTFPLEVWRYERSLPRPANT